MVNAIHYKLKSEKSFRQLPIAGILDTITLAELKRKIILDRNLIPRFDKGSDFDLKIFNEQGEEYENDKTTIPLNSCVIVQRVSAPKNVALAYVRPADSSASVGFQHDVQEHQITVRPNYVCRLCNERGHHIRFCPLKYDVKHNRKAAQQAKEPKGIPRCYLKPVDGANQENNNNFGGLQIAGVGQVVMVPNSTEFDLQAQRFAPLSSFAFIIPSHLECVACSSLLKDAVRVPCCHSAFCAECISSSLLSQQQSQQRSPSSYPYVLPLLSCPHCGATNCSLDRIIIDAQLRRDVAELERSRMFSHPPSSSFKVENAFPSYPQQPHQRRHGPQEHLHRPRSQRSQHQPQYPRRPHGNFRRDSALSLASVPMKSSPLLRTPIALSAH